MIAKVSWLSARTRVSDFGSPGPPHADQTRDVSQCVLAALPRRSVGGASSFLHRIHAFLGGQERRSFEALACSTGGYCDRECRRSTSSGNSQIAIVS